MNANKNDPHIPNIPPEIKPLKPEMPVETPAPEISPVEEPIPAGTPPEIIPLIK